MEKNENTPVLSDFSKSMLDKMNWAGLQEKHGITREMVEANPAVLAKLANFEVAGPLKVETEKISGDVFLRAYYKSAPRTGEAKPFTITADLREDKKSISEFNSLTPKERVEKGYKFGDTPITSSRAIEAMLARTDYIGQGGKKVNAPAYANAGFPLGRIRRSDEKKSTDYYLVGYDQNSRKFFGTSVRDVKAYLNSVGKSFYGIALGDDAKKDLANGQVISVDVVNTKTGETSKIYGQFNPVAYAVTAVHPLGLKEIESIRANVAPEVKAVEAQAETKKETKAKAQKPAGETKKKTVRKVK